MNYQTPNWPHDLTPEQQMDEERELVAEINATCARIVPHVIKRINELMAKAMAD